MSAAMGVRMSSNHLTGKQMRPASALEDRHLGWNIRIGGVTGTLTGILPIPNGGGFELAVLVGGARAWFPLASDAGVEVWR